LCHLRLRQLQRWHVLRLLLLPLLQRPRCLLLQRLAGCWEATR
jgi:hypothetical protein